MPTVAFATCRDLPDLDPDDRELLAPLRERGVDVVPAVWTDSTFEWHDVDLVVLRSCWDYHLDVDGFRAWIDSLERTGVAVANPPPVLRWNLDKRHLGALSERGIAIPITTWVDAGTPASLRSILEDAHIETGVVKPVISLSAYRTWRVDVNDVDEDRWRSDTAAADVMVQQFVPEIATDGEWSLIFFGEAFSHARIKRPRTGDFRVQSEHGGSNAAAVPDPRLVSWAKTILATIHGLGEAMRNDFVYARVDAVRTSSGYVLMEIELIDPSLYLFADRAAAGRAADAIAARAHR